MQVRSFLRAEVAGIHELQQARLLDDIKDGARIFRAGEFAHDTPVTRDLDQVFADAQSIGAVLNDSTRGFHFGRAWGLAGGKIGFEQNLQATLEVQPETGTNVLLIQDGVIEWVFDLNLTIYANINCQ